MKPDLLQGWTVLVVDDEMDGLQVAEMLLAMSGAVVYTALTGSEALKIMQAVTPTFILSDLSMPEMTGWEFVAQLRGNPALQNIPVIALTAHTTGADREYTLSAGFQGFLIKPLKPKTFIQDLCTAFEHIPDLADRLNKGELPRE